MKSEGTQGIIVLVIICKYASLNKKISITLCSCLVNDIKHIQLTKNRLLLINKISLLKYQ